MSSKSRTPWSEWLIDENEHSEKIMAASKYAVLIFFNFFVDADLCMKKSGSKVRSKLGLEEWTTDFKDAAVVDIVVAGVSTKNGRSHGALVPFSPCVTFVLIEKRQLHFTKDREYCNESVKLNGYCPSSVACCDFQGTFRKGNYYIICFGDSK